MKTTMNVLFKSLQKDDKKEILKFEIKGTEDVGDEIDLCRIRLLTLLIPMKTNQKIQASNTQTTLKAQIFLSVTLTTCRSK
ncbi:hypothetical protein [Paenibacillus sp. sgz5001063]|uniref:hypothetical protein n=1 Tax=Paenibacillus sp. sgz5001063 TaxID=3242474 RepID=UPI0036D275F9